MVQMYLGRIQIHSLFSVTAGWILWQAQGLKRVILNNLLINNEFAFQPLHKINHLIQ